MSSSDHCEAVSPHPCCRDHPGEAECFVIIEPNNVCGYAKCRSCLKSDASELEDLLSAIVPALPQAEAIDRIAVGLVLFGDVVK